MSNFKFLVDKFLPDKIKKSLYMCYVLACGESNTVLKLSHHKIESFGETLSLVSSDLIQVISTAREAKLLNSTSVDNLDTVSCFLNCQATKFELK